MNLVTKVKDLDKYIMYFSGKDVSDSIRLAEEWAIREKVKLNNYYIQVSSNRSILVGYFRKEEE